VPRSRLGKATSSPARRSSLARRWRPTSSSVWVSVRPSESTILGMAYLSILDLLGIFDYRVDSGGRIAPGSGEESTFHTLVNTSKPAICGPQPAISERPRLVRVHPVASSRHKSEWTFVRQFPGRTQGRAVIEQTIEENDGRGVGRSWPQSSTGRSVPRRFSIILRPWRLRARMAAEQKKPWRIEIS
jgi:hypothetical protein